MQPTGPRAGKSIDVPVLMLRATFLLRFGIGDKVFGQPCELDFHPVAPKSVLGHVLIAISLHS